MRSQSAPGGAGRGQKRAGRYRLVLCLGISGAAALAGCAGQSTHYPGVPQPALSQVDYFQPGQEQQLKAEATRLRQAAQLPPYDEAADSATQ